MSEFDRARGEIAKVYQEKQRQEELRQKQELLRVHLAQKEEERKNRIKENFQGILPILPEIFAETNREIFDGKGRVHKWKHKIKLVTRYSYGSEYTVTFCTGSSLHALIVYETKLDTKVGKICAFVPILDISLKENWKAGFNSHLNPLNWYWYPQPAEEISINGRGDYIDPKNTSLNDPFDKVVTKITESIINAAIDLHK